MILIVYIYCIERRETPKLMTNDSRLEPPSFKSHFCNGNISFGQMNSLSRANTHLSLVRSWIVLQTNQEVVEYILIDLFYQT